MPLTRQQALDHFHSPDLIGLGFEADAVRRRLHPEGVVTYIIDRNINYTNFCTEYCTFCAFYRPLKGPRTNEGYILEFEKIYEKIAETLEMGGTGVLMQGGIHPDLKIDWFERLFSGIKQRFPQIWLHCLSASEVLAIAEYSELSLRDTIARLRDAGLDSIPGGGAEILDDEVRHRIARLKCNTEDWVSVHRTAHKLGMRTTATMMFGVGETFDQRINHFEVVRHLQEETGGFTAFIPWSFQPGNTALGGRGWEEATSVEYLKVLAIARLYLDNIENVQASWVTQGLKVLELGLHFGGNDVGSVMLEENVVRAAGTSNCKRKVRGLAHYQVGGNLPLFLSSLGVVVLNSGAQRFDGGCSEIFARHLHSSQRRQHELREMDVIEPHDGNVARHVAGGAEERMKSADGGHIVGTHYGGWHFDL
jgi:cyclic dehypoxanthinyl futalosine synthase